MKKLILLLASIAMIYSLASADPQILVPEQNWDFGYVPQNGILTHDYPVVNIGTDTLRIIKVKPG